MKIQVSNSNEPQWRSITVKSELPGKLNKLNELSRNLWWAWNTEGKTLFHDLDRDTWRATRRIRQCWPASIAPTNSIRSI